MTTTTTTGSSTTSVLPGTTTAPSTGTESWTGSSDDSSAASSTDTTTFDAGDLPDVGILPEGCKTKKIDILFLVGQSEFMAPHYGKLVKSLPSFVEVLENQLSEFDPHILVPRRRNTWGAPVSCPIGQETCPEDGGCAELDEPNYPCWALYTPGAVTPCDRTVGAGVVFTAGKEASNKPCELVDDRRYIHAEEPDILEAFMCVASEGHSVGVDGEGWAAGRAVSPELAGPGGCNEGFLRDDALLLLVMVSLGTDSGSPYNPYVWANTILDAKGGEQDAIFALGIFADNDTPDPICDWPWNGGQRQLRSMLLNFEHVLFGSLCESSTAYESHYASTAEVILDVCGGPIPK